MWYFEHSQKQCGAQEFNTSNANEADMGLKSLTHPMQMTEYKASNFFVTSVIED